LQFLKDLYIVRNLFIDIFQKQTHETIIGMMEFDLYFKPISQKIEKLKKLPDAKDRMIDITFHSASEKVTKLDGFDIVIFGVGEERASENIGTTNAPDEIREKLYSLFKPSPNLKICDLGNLNLGKTIKDTYIALKELILEFRSKNIVPIVIGGSQDLTFPIYEAYRKVENFLNLVIIDSVIDFSTQKNEITSTSYIHKIIQTQNNRIFNISVLGYQNYLVNSKTVEKMRKLLLDTYRLGLLRANLIEIEPILRDAHFLSFDMGAIKQADSPGNATPSPNGFDSVEACQIAEYAGLSDNLSCFGLFEVNPLFDNNKQTTHLAAQIIWHFIEGFYLRMNDLPNTDTDDYKKFIVNIDNVNQNLVFYKSMKTNRWWIEIPVTGTAKKLVSCSYNDYLSASKQEIPDIWWKTFQKLSR